MGMVKIQVWGSFGDAQEFQTCAEEGGHVAAVKRGIKFLADVLPNAVRLDAKLTAEGITPPSAPLGGDK